MSHFVSKGGNFDDLQAQLERRDGPNAEEDDEQQRSTHTSQHASRQNSEDESTAESSTRRSEHGGAETGARTHGKRAKGVSFMRSGGRGEGGGGGGGMLKSGMTRTNSIVPNSAQSLRARPGHGDAAAQDSPTTPLLPHHHAHHGRHHHHHHHKDTQDTQQGIQEHVLSSSAQARLHQSGVLHRAASVPRKLGTWDGVFMPVSLNILGIILFLRFGFILGQVGLIGALLLLALSYAIDAFTAMSVSAISTNGQVRGGGAYYLISRSLGPEFGGSIGLIFFVGQALNSAMNVLGFVESLTDAFGETREGFLPEGPWWSFSYGSVCLLVSTLVCLVGSSFFKKATLALAVVLGAAIVSIPISSLFVKPFVDLERGAYYTGWSISTLRENLLPHFTSGAIGSSTGDKKENWQTVFGVLFPAVTGLLAGVSMSGDLRKPSKSIPKGTNLSLIFTFVIYVLAFVVFAGTIARQSFYLDVGIVSDVALSPQLITFGVLASTGFSALMGVMACGKVLQAIARDDLLPVLKLFAQGTEVNDTPIYAVTATWAFCQAVLFVDSVNLIAQLVTMTSLLTFGSLSFATLALKAGGAPSFRPSFRYWNIWTAGTGTVACFGAMFFTAPFAASGCIVVAIFLFSAIHIFCPPKPWGDVTRNLNYHIVRKYLLRLDERKGRVTHWRPQILLLTNNARSDWNLIIFCNSLKKGALYVLGHILKGEFEECLGELRKQHIAWLKLVDVSGIKSFVNVIIARDEREGARNLILSCGLGGMRPNIVCLGFPHKLPKTTPIAVRAAAKMKGDDSEVTIRAELQQATAAGLNGDHVINVRVLPTDVGRNETPIMPTTFVGILEDALALQKALAVAYGFENMSLDGPSTQYRKKTKADEGELFIDLWPVQIQSPDADQSHAWDTYTMILQLGTILSMTGSWKNHKLRVSVFVEFEEDAEEERRRVRSLLDNLRVPASLRVFCLSAEQVVSYGCIVRGKEPVPASIDAVLTGDPWWEMLKSLRKEEARRVREAAADDRRRSGAQPMQAASPGSSERRQSKREQRMLGVSLPKEHLEFFQRNMRIGLAHPRAGRQTGLHGRRQSESAGWGDRVVDGESESESEMSASDSGSESDLSDELARLNLDDLDWMSSSAGSNLRRARTYSTGHAQAAAARRGKPLRARTMDTEQHDEVVASSYGSMSTTPRPSTIHRPPTVQEHVAPDDKTTQVDDEAADDPDGTLRASDRARMRAQLLQQEQQKKAQQLGAGDWTQNGLRTSKDQSRQSSRPSSRARRRSASSVSDVSAYAADQEEGGDDVVATQAAPTLLAAPPRPTSSVSMDEKPLVTFNHLPNKAQYLILNELIRSNSTASTSVVLTALPAPEAGTSQDPLRSLRYLQHLESLFGGGPPVLGVHAKQLTMTSAL